MQHNVKLWRCLAILIALTGCPAGAVPAEPLQSSTPHGIDGPIDGTLIVIRHAERPDAGSGLSPAGQQHARKYVDYFRHLTVLGAPVHIDALIATADSPKSQRPRLTLEPLSMADGMSIQQPFPDKKVNDLADWIRRTTPGKTTLIAWHHGKLPKLLADLGADVGNLLPNGKWPGDVYRWTVVLTFDHNGRLASSNRLEQ